MPLWLYASNAHGGSHRIAPYFNPDSSSVRLQKVFSHVKAIRGEDSDDVQTITLMASSRPIEFNNGWTRYMGDFRGIDPIGDSLRRLSVEPPSGEGFVLTDDHNPIDYLRTGEALRWRERTLTFIGRQAMQF